MNSFKKIITIFGHWIAHIRSVIGYKTKTYKRNDGQLKSNLKNEEQIVTKIQHAIYEATGMKPDEYTGKSRKRDLFYIRMIFVYYCYRDGMRIADITKYVNRDRTTLIYLPKKFEDEKKYNDEFRNLAQRVENVLIKIK